jgi:hypothetical protein
MSRGFESRRVFFSSGGSMTLEEALQLADDFLWQEEDHSTYPPTIQALLVLAREIERIGPQHQEGSAP